MPSEPTPADLQRLGNGFQVSQALHVAAELGIADLLRDGPRAVDDLAAAAGAHPRTLYRLLRALAAAGVFHEQADQRFALTPLGQFLRADHPASLAPWLALIGRPYFWQAWGHLRHSVRTGENAFAALNDTDVWSWRASRPEESAIFDRAMAGLARTTNATVIGAFDFGRFKHLVDVGGGNGAFLAAVLRANPASRGTVFDQPHVVEGAAAILRDAGVDDRCDAVGGSMFESVPSGADAYIMQRILHDWDDARCGEILAVLRATISPGARLLVVEQLIGPPNEGVPAKLADLNMLVLPGGEERTEQEFAALFAASGFKLTGVTRTSGPWCILEAAPA